MIMDESFLDDAIPSVLSKTVFQTFILMLVMRVAWSVVSFDRDTKIVSLKHLESSRSLHGWSFIPHIYYGYRCKETVLPTAYSRLVAYIMRHAIFGLTCLLPYTF